MFFVEFRVIPCVDYAVRGVCCGLNYRSIVTSDPLQRYMRRRSARTGRMRLLRPMTVGEIADAALEVVQTLGWKAISGVALPAILIAAGAAFWTTILLPNIGSTSAGASKAQQLSEVLTLLCIGVLIATPILVFGIAALTAYISSMASDVIFERQPDAASASKLAWRHSGKLFLLSIAMSLIPAAFLIPSFLFLGLSTADVPVEVAGISSVLGIAGLSFSFFAVPAAIAYQGLATPALIFEELTVREAVRRSKGLLKGGPNQSSGFGSIIQVLWVVLLIAFFLRMGLAGIGSIVDELLQVSRWFARQGFERMGDILYGFLAMFLTAWFVVPVWAVGSTLAYFERRARTEGLDIATLAKEARIAAPSDRFQL